MNEEKKVYTMEDNVRSISFTIKDLVREINDLTQVVRQIVEQLHRLS